MPFAAYQQVVLCVCFDPEPMFLVKPKQAEQLEMGAEITDQGRVCAGGTSLQPLLKYKFMYNSRETLQDR